MADLELTLLQIRRRLMLAAFLENAVRGLLVAGLAAVALLLVSKLVVVPLLLPVEVWSAIACGVALVVAGIVTWVRRPAMLRAALAADERLGLCERLSSAYLLRGAKDEVGAVAALEADARRHASAIVPARDFKVKPPRLTPHLLWPVVVFAALHLFLPQMNLFASEEKGDAPTAADPAKAGQEVRRAQAREIRELARKAKEAKEQAGVEGLADFSKDLERLANDLEMGLKDRKVAVAELSRLEDEVRAERKTLSKQLEPFKQIQGLARAEQTRELQQALKNQDFDAAARQMQQLAQQALQQQSPQQMEKLAQELQQLANETRQNPQVSQALQQAAQALQQAAQQAQQQQPGQQSQQQSGQQQQQAGQQQQQNSQPGQQEQNQQGQQSQQQNQAGTQANPQQGGQQPQGGQPSGQGAPSQQQQQAMQQAQQAMQQAAQQILSQQQALQQMQQLDKLSTQMSQCQSRMANQQGQQGQPSPSGQAGTQSQQGGQKGQQGGQAGNQEGQGQQGQGASNPGDGQPGQGQGQGGNGEWQEGFNNAEGLGTGGPGRGRGGEPPDAGLVNVQFQDELIRGAVNEGEIIAVIEIDAPAMKGESNVRYTEIYEKQAQRAAEAIKQTEIPLGYREAVKGYFESINPERQVRK